MGAAFTNAFGTTWRQPLTAMMRWGFQKVAKDKRLGSTDVPHRYENDGRALESHDPHLTWVGHSSFLLRLGGQLVAIDPVWANDIAYVERLVAPSPSFEALPRVDVVTVTHNHYDHLDLPTLERMRDAFDPEFIVPLGHAPLLAKRGITQVTELDWWESINSGDLEITLVPAQHWSSRRWVLDLNQSLWGGFVYRSKEASVYNAGDTAFEPRLFRKIAERFPNLDCAMLPIGAYDPEWFLRTQHMNPEDVGRAFEILRARTLVPMHYGTYRLTDEPVGEPLERLERYFERRDGLSTLQVGETRSLRPEAADVELGLAS